MPALILFQSLLRSLFPSSRKMSTKIITYPRPILDLPLHPRLPSLRWTEKKPFSLNLAFVSLRNLDLLRRLAFKTLSIELCRCGLFTPDPRRLRLGQRRIICSGKVSFWLEKEGFDYLFWDYYRFPWAAGITCSLIQATPALRPTRIRPRPQPGRPSTCILPPHPRSARILPQVSWDRRAARIRPRKPLTICPRIICQVKGALEWLVPVDWPQFIQGGPPFPPSQTFVFDHKDDSVTPTAPSPQPLLKYHLIHQASVFHKEGSSVQWWRKRATSLSIIFSSRSPRKGRSWPTTTGRSSALRLPPLRPTTGATSSPPSYPVRVRGPI